VRDKHEYYQATSADVEEFLREARWSFEAKGFFRLVDSEVCNRAWRDSFGVPPPQHWIAVAVAACQ